MPRGDRLGVAGLIVGLLGIAAFYLLPDEKWVGQLCLLAAFLLLIWWIVREIKEAGRGLKKLRTSKWGYVSACVLVVLLIVSAYDYFSRDIHVRRVDVLPLNDNSQNQSQGYPVAKVHAINNGFFSRKVYMVSHVDLVPLPLDWSSKKNEYEDQLWDSTESFANHGTDPTVVSSNVPLVNTIYGAELSLLGMQAVAANKAALYVMVIYRYHDMTGTHESDVCVYVEGNVQEAQLCHDHNNW